ncbi:hypothetical protein P171DRAFT_481195 [Karstenula rhodostoma CBS 690.94]|uniref:Uncharacterized protein n=1 Tax=Karstenula rhodostoma CBS 690.94 TaxID=1392251 RepID=A0A9P4UF34_9PLEO|nr:hypothetical protein P171DRAFT_481195 [Karstenula rhodostoma CBS 690.94]
MAAFSPLPFWDYVYQLRHTYPNEHRRCLTRNVSLLMGQPGGHGEVVEITAAEAEDGEGEDEGMVVAGALWVQRSEGDALPRLPAIMAGSEDDGEDVLLLHGTTTPIYNSHYPALDKLHARAVFLPMGFTLVAVISILLWLSAVWNWYIEQYLEIQA